MSLKIQYTIHNHIEGKKMKTGMIAILIAIGPVFGMRLDAQTWTQQTSNTTSTLWGVSFIDNNTGWVCGYGGTILKTTDGGVHWFSQSSGTTYQLAGIKFVDANIGFTVSYLDKGGILLRTTDGGNTWNNISLNILNARSGGSWIFGSGIGLWAVGDSNYANSKILKTTNGGNSWDTVYSGGTGWISFMDFPDMNNGYVTVSGSIILKTIDGGASWNSLSVGGNLWMSGVYFFNKDTGLVSGGNLSDTVYGGSIFKTTDGGNNWQTLTTTCGTSVMLFTSSNTGYAIGFHSGDTIKKLITTTDGGATWAQDNTTRKNLNGICFPSANFGYAVGDSGIILKYIGVTGVSSNPISLPLHFNLIQNYPNPFNPSTNISFDLPAKSFVSLRVFDLIGRDVATIVSEEMPAGSYSRTWNALNMSSGIYFYRLQAGIYTQTKKLVLLK